MNKYQNKNKIRIKKINKKNKKMKKNNIPRIIKMTI